MGGGGLKDVNIQIISLVLEEDTKFADLNKIWKMVKEGLLKAAWEVCGWTKGQAWYQQTGWWNKEVRKSMGKGRL